MIKYKVLMKIIKEILFSAIIDSKFQTKNRRNYGALFIYCG